MEKIRLTKDFHFQAGHALFGHDGMCKNLHGHNYKLSVTVEGYPNTDRSSPKLGMVIDFSELKEIVVKHVIKYFDHHTILNVDTDHKKIAKILESHGHKVMKVDYNPTCEMMLIDFSQRIKDKLPSRVFLHSLTLYETRDSYAYWLNDDIHAH